MITIEIDGIPKNIDLRRQDHTRRWWYFNVIETGKDGLGHPVSEHSVPIYFIEQGGTVKTGGHTYRYKKSR